MASEEEIYRLIVDIQGKEDVARLTAEAKKQEDELRRLSAELRKGSISQQQFATDAKKAATDLSRLNKELQNVQKATGSSSGATQRLTQLGYTVDDLQYGFKGIANNIQPLLSTIPALAGIAPVLAIAATAAYQLYSHWDQLADLLGTGTTKTEAQRMEELKDKTEKTADETLRLLKYERERKSLAIQNQQTKAQVETQGTISEALREVGHDKVDSTIDQLYGDRIRNSVSDEKTRAARLAKGKLNEAQGTLDTLARKDPGEVTKHEFDQARKNRDKADVAFGKALDAFNKEYGEKRDTLKGQLATDVDKNGNAPRLEKFVADALAKGLISAEEAASLRDAQPARQEAKAEQARLNKEKNDAATKQANYEFDLWKEKVQENSAGLAEKFSPAILNNIARGHANDPAALTAKISETLQKGGKDQAEADSVAPQIASDLLRKIGLQVTERSNTQGLSKEEAAAREAEDAAASARSRAPLPKGTIGDASSFAHNLQQALFNKVDPIQQAILDVNRLQADKLEKLIEETRKVKPRDKVVAVAAGPA